MSSIRSAVPPHTPSIGGHGPAGKVTPQPPRLPVGPAPSAHPLQEHLKTKTGPPGGRSAAGIFQAPRGGPAATRVHQPAQPRPAAQAARPSEGTAGLSRLADEIGQKMAALADPEQRPQRELQRLHNPRTGAAMGTISGHPKTLGAATEQIYRAVKATPAGLTPVVLNLAERKDHPPGVKHVTDHFPENVAVRVGPHHTITRLKDGTRDLGPNARGEPMQARLSILRLTDERTGAHKNVRHIDVENFTDGSTPSDQALKQIEALTTRGAPLIVNCEAGIGRSAMLWMLHALYDYIAEQNKLGHRVTKKELCQHAHLLHRVAHEQRGQALLPDAWQNSAVLRLALEALPHQSVPPPAATSPAVSTRPAQPSLPPRAPMAVRG